MDLLLTECGYFSHLSTKKSQLSALVHRVIHKKFPNLFVGETRNLWLDCISCVHLCRKVRLSRLLLPICTSPFCCRKQQKSRFQKCCTGTWVLTHLCRKVIIDPINTRVHVGRVRKRSTTEDHMPKSTKRIETKRAAKIAKAHATNLPQPQAKVAPSRRSPGYKAPTRGIARYPVLVTIVGILVVSSL